jgi:signal transduction histidine kinase
MAGVFSAVDPQRRDARRVVVLVPLADAGAPPLAPRAAVFFAALLVLALGGVLLAAADLTRPLAALERQAADMNQGMLHREVHHDGELDTSGRLSSAFEQMRRTLLRKLRTIEKLNEELEEKVRLRTAELEESNAELTETVRKLQETQQQLVTSEKMASVGQLVAGIAHEINNPINAVVNTLEPLSEALEELARARASGAPDEGELEALRGDVRHMLRVIRSGTERTLRIVGALRSYTRQDGEARAAVDLHAELDETLALLQHKLRGVEVQRDYGASGQLSAFRGQLNQALMNVLANAAAAVDGRDEPQLTVRTRDRGERVAIEVEDNGPGIPEEVLPRIFDPFFTTKEVGQGTGLGLSITHGIVERHGGEITARSEPGCTVFVLELPRG